MADSNPNYDYEKYIITLDDGFRASDDCVLILFINAMCKAVFPSSSQAVISHPKLTNCSITEQWPKITKEN